MDITMKGKDAQGYRCSYYSGAVSSVIAIPFLSFFFLHQQDFKIVALKNTRSSVFSS